jgi:HSP20 family protein
MINIFERKLKPVSIFSYRRVPQSDLAVNAGRLAAVQEELDRVFDSSFGSFFRPLDPFKRWNPAVDVYQDNDQFTVYAELPGLKKEEIKISLDNDTLTIGGERRHEGSADQGLRTERYFGKFQRSLTLPVSVNSEKVNATYKDGILKVTLPKAEEAKPKQIPVSVS